MTLARTVRRLRNFWSNTPTYRRNGSRTWPPSGTDCWNEPPSSSATRPRRSRQPRHALASLGVRTHLPLWAGWIASDQAAHREQARVKRGLLGASVVGLASGAPGCRPLLTPVRLSPRAPRGTCCRDRSSVAPLAIESKDPLCRVAGPLGGLHVAPIVLIELASAGGRDLVMALWSL